VPTYNIKVVLPQGSGLQPSNQGAPSAATRVGIVGSLSPAPGSVDRQGHGDRQPEAGKRAVEPLPADTRATVLSVSAIGLKYLELEKGTSSKTIKAGHEIPVSQTTEPVDIDQFVQHVRRKKRARRFSRTPTTSATAWPVAALEINDAIATLKPLVTNAIPRASQPRPRRRPTCAGSSKGLDRPAEQTAPGGGPRTPRCFSEQDNLLHGLRERRENRWKKRPRGRPGVTGTGRSARCRLRRPFTEKSTEFMRLLRPSAEAAHDGRPSRSAMPSPKARSNLRKGPLR